MKQLARFDQTLLARFGRDDYARARDAMQRLTLILMAMIFTLQLLAPILTWKRLLPRTVVYLEHPLLLLILSITVARMLVFNRIPLAILFIAAMSVIWSVVALFGGQGVAATLWGWWNMFRYPLIALFIYVEPEWPAKSAAWLLQGLWVLLGAELLIQIAQFATGEIPGDNLAGTFGAHGVGPLFFFLLLTLCIAFGVWLAANDWRPLLYVAVIGSLASSLSETKVYPIVLGAIALIALVIYLAKGGRIGTVAVYIASCVAIVFIFIIFYNITVSETRGIRTIQTFFDPAKVDRYLNNMNYDSEAGVYHLGRSFALRHGWELLQRDSTTLLFGYGIGTRSESTALGIVGAGLADSYFGLATGTSLLVMMQELGLVGLALLGCFVLWICALLAFHLPHEADPAIRALCYGIILFSLFWPLWLYYHQPWDFSVFMLLYWGIVGFLCRIAIVTRTERRMQLNALCIA